MSYISSSSFQTGLVRPPSFPFWVVQKIGIPIFTDADFNYPSIPNGKFGATLTGTSSIARDTTTGLFGGLGSVKMLTDATSGDVAEVKLVLQNIMKKGQLLAFEMKWSQAFASGSTQIHVGIEPRSHTRIIHARFRYSKNLGKWQIENADTTFSDFPASVGGALSIETPTADAAAGSDPNWVRIVVDPINLLYVSFETSGINGYEVRDLRPLNLPLVIEGSSASNGALLLFFVLLQTLSTNAEPAFTTDWCISIIPQGINPF